MVHKWLAHLDGANHKTIVERRLGNSLFLSYLTSNFGAIRLPCPPLPSPDILFFNLDEYNFARAQEILRTDDNLSGSGSAYQATNLSSCTDMAPRLPRSSPAKASKKRMNPTAHDPADGTSAENPEPKRRRKSGTQTPAPTKPQSALATRRGLKLQKLSLPAEPSGEQSQHGVSSPIMVGGPSPSQVGSQESIEESLSSMMPPASPYRSLQQTHLMQTMPSPSPRSMNQLEDSALSFPMDNPFLLSPGLQTGVDNFGYGAPMASTPSPRSAPRKQPNASTLQSAMLPPSPLSGSPNQANRPANSLLAMPPSLPSFLSQHQAIDTAHHSPMMPPSYASPVSRNQTNATMHSGAMLPPPSPSPVSQRRNDLVHGSPMMPPATPTSAYRYRENAAQGSPMMPLAHLSFLSGNRQNGLVQPRRRMPRPTPSPLSQSQIIGVDQASTMIHPPTPTSVSRNQNRLVHSSPMGPPSFYQNQQNRHVQSSPMRPSPLYQTQSAGLTQSSPFGAPPLYQSQVTDLADFSLMSPAHPPQYQNPPYLPNRPISPFNMMQSMIGNTGYQQQSVGFQPPTAYAQQAPNMTAGTASFNPTNNQPRTSNPPNNTNRVSSKRARIPKVPPASDEWYKLYDNLPPIGSEMSNYMDFFVAQMEREGVDLMSGM